MKFLFVSRWYHPNQHPIVKSLLNNGHDFKFISVTEFETENHSVLKPDVVGYSKLKPKIDKIKRKVGKESTTQFPNLIPLYKSIVDFDPDVVIIRNYEVYSLLSFVISKKYGYNVIFHEQMEMCRPDSSKKKSVADRIHQYLFGNGIIRITPIKGDCEKHNSTRNVYYFPFVFDPELQQDFTKKEFFQEGNINIIMVGKLWQDRKNHIHLLDAVDRLRSEYNIQVTLVGSLPKKKDYKQVRMFINDCGMEDIVDIKANLPFEKLQQLYFNHDLFVLPSRGESAAVSPLEAMANGLPVISSDNNGTRCYINEGENGYIFETGNIDDLEKKVRWIIHDRDELVRMGKKSYELANQNHHPDVYRERFIELINTVF